MDIATIAIAAAALLARKAAEGGAGEAGKSGWRGITRLYELVRKKLSRNAEDSSALDSLEAAPDNEANRQAVAAVVARAAEQDTEFRHELEALIADAQHNQAAGRIVNQIFGQAQVGKVVSIEGDVSGGLSF